MSDSSKQRQRACGEPVWSSREWYTTVNGPGGRWFRVVFVATTVRFVRAPDRDRRPFCFRSVVTVREGKTKEPRQGQGVFLVVMM